MPTLFSAVCRDSYRLEQACCGMDADLFSLDDRPVPMTIPFGEPEPNDALLKQSVVSSRLRAWLGIRLRELASAQRIQDARSLRSEFSIE